MRFAHLPFVHGSHCVYFTVLVYVVNTAKKPLDNVSGMTPNLVDSRR